MLLAWVTSDTARCSVSWHSSLGKEQQYISETEPGYNGNLSWSEIAPRNIASIKFKICLGNEK
jgi:hypothetical protein